MSHDCSQTIIHQNLHATLCSWRRKRRTCSTNPDWAVQSPAGISPRIIDTTHIIFNLGEILIIFGADIYNFFSFNSLNSVYFISDWHFQAQSRCSLGLLAFLSDLGMIKILLHKKTGNRSTELSKHLNTSIHIPFSCLFNNYNRGEVIRLQEVHVLSSRFSRGEVWKLQLSEAVECE